MSGPPGRATTPASTTSPWSRSPKPSRPSFVDQLLGAPDLPSAAKQRLWQATDGNPLFIEELVAKLMDDGTLTRAGGRWTAVADLASVPVPPTISALLAARLEQLDAGHRDLLERASVLGKDFDRAAVMLAPAPARARLDADPRRSPTTG